MTQPTYTLAETVVRAAALYYVDEVADGSCEESTPSEFRGYFLDEIDEGTLEGYDVKRIVDGYGIMEAMSLAGHGEDNKVVLLIADKGIPYEGLVPVILRTTWDEVTSSIPWGELQGAVDAEREAELNVQNDDDDWGQEEAAKAFEVARSNLIDTFSWARDADDEYDRMDQATAFLGQHPDDGDVDFYFDAWETLQEAEGRREGLVRALADAKEASTKLLEEWRTKLAPEPATEAPAWSMTDEHEEYLTQAGEHEPDAYLARVLRHLASGKAHRAMDEAHEATQYVGPTQEDTERMRAAFASSAYKSQDTSSALDALADKLDPRG